MSNSNRSTNISAHSLFSEQAETNVFKACSNIMKKIEPNDSKECVAALCHLLSYESNDDLFRSRPHIKGLVAVSDIGIIKSDDEKIKPFICCDFNCHPSNQNWYRSPWRNLYFEKTDDAYHQQAQKDSEEDMEVSEATRWIRNLELLANELWETYTRLYYGVSYSDESSVVAVVPSVYLWESQQNDAGSKQKNCRIIFEGCFAIYKKATMVNDDVSKDNKKKNEKIVTWISLHQVQVSEDAADNCITYLVNSTFDVTINAKDSLHKTLPSNGANIKSDEKNDSFNYDIKGQYFREKMEKQQQQKQHQQSYLSSLGQMIEQIEIDVRSNMNCLSIQLTKDVVTSLNSEQVDKFQQDQQQKHAIMLSEAIFLGKNQQGS
jgi:hypothetical protein